MNTITLYKTQIKFLLEHLDTEAIKIINIKNDTNKKTVELDDKLQMLNDICDKIQQQL